MNRILHLFEGFGVELEYMIVNSEDLSIRPVADIVLRDQDGNPCAEIEQGPTAWSNELTAHVIELKTNGPSPTLNGLDAAFAADIQRINREFSSLGAKLLPTAVHPLMDSLRETILWPHEYNDVYALYNSVFDCKGHGWSNVQSTHLNLPFCGDEEFGRLHAAIRLLLPLIPALAASSPVLDGRDTGFRDARLEAYSHNQIRIPSIAGRIIPEGAFTQADYEERIFAPMMRDIAPHDPENILDRHFLNSRGAIARFDRNAIEIRLVDVQECPAADIAIAATQVALLKELIAERWGSFTSQAAWKEERLREILMGTIREGEDFVIHDGDYLEALGRKRNPLRAGDLWSGLLEDLDFPQLPLAGTLVKAGTLSTRILNALGKNFSHADIIAVYKELADCLDTNTPFVPSAACSS